MLHSSFRVLLALVIAPFATAPGLALSTLIARFAFSDPSNAMVLDHMPYIALIAIPIAAVVLVVVGVPLHLLMSWIGWSSYAVYGAAGCLVGLTVFTVILLFQKSNLGLDSSFVLVVLMFCTPGVLIALVARWIAGVFPFPRPTPESDNGGA